MVGRIHREHYTDYMGYESSASHQADCAGDRRTSRRSRTSRILSAHHLYHYTKEARYEIRAWQGTASGSSLHRGASRKHAVPRRRLDTAAWDKLDRTEHHFSRSSRRTDRTGVLAVQVGIAAAQTLFSLGDGTRSLSLKRDA